MTHDHKAFMEAIALKGLRFIERERPGTGNEDRCPLSAVDSFLIPDSTANYLEQRGEGTG